MPAGIADDAADDRQEAADEDRKRSPALEEAVHDDERSCVKCTYFPYRSMSGTPP